MNGFSYAPGAASCKLPPLARKSKSLDPLPGMRDASQQNDQKSGSAMDSPSGVQQPAAAPHQEGKGDAAGVPVFVMLPLDSVRCMRPLSSQLVRL